MNEILSDQEPRELDPLVAGVYEAAVAQHTIIALEKKTEVEDLIAQTLARSAEFEAIAAKPVTMTREEAESIGSIFVLSGTGNYDEPFKPGENPRLEQPWMGGQDRERMLHATRLALQIAQLRAGEEPGPIKITAEHPDPTARARELIAEFGPTIVYAGYEVETDAAKELLRRPEVIVPEEKADIIDSDPAPTNTAEQIKKFVYPSGTEGEDVVIVSHAPHLAGRVLHIVEQIKQDGDGPFDADFVPIMSPVQTSTKEGKAQFAAMEAQGLVAYHYKYESAAAEPSPYRILGHPEHKES